MRPQEVLQNLFSTHSAVRMRWKSGAMVVYWDLDIMVPKNRIGEHTLKKVAKFSTKWCCIVGNTIYMVPGGIGNIFYISMGRWEYGGTLVSWSFIEPWTLRYPITALGSMLKKSQTTAQNIVIPLFGQYIWDLRRCYKTFFQHIVRWGYGGNLVPWLYIEP